MGVLLDIEDGGEIHVTATNTEARRTAIVDELEGSDADAMLYDALVTLAAETTPIVIGAAHPSIPSVVITAMDAYPIKGCARARVELLYGIPQYTLPGTPGTDGPDTKSVRFSGEPKDYTTDPLDPGTDLTVSAPPAYAGLPDQTKTITVNKGRGVIVFTRSEPAMPLARMRTYMNKINSAVLGSSSEYAIGTVYCNVIQGDQAGDGDPIVRYEFIYDPDGFDIEYSWERPPLVVPAHDSGSRKTIAPYDSIDFSGLGLDWDD